MSESIHSTTGISQEAIQNNNDFHNKAYIESIPRSLRHGTKDDPIYEALAIANFMQAVLTGEALDPDAVHGMYITFDLIQDKLRIALGELPFPTTHYDKAAPVLWPPKGGGHE